MTIQTRLMAEQEVEDITGIPRGTRAYMSKKGIFPAPVIVSYRKTAYFEDEINAWLEACRKNRSIKAENPWCPSRSADVELQSEVMA